MEKKKRTLRKLRSCFARVDTYRVARAQLLGFAFVFFFAERLGGVIAAIGLLAIVAVGIMVTAAERVQTKQKVRSELPATAYTTVVSLMAAFVLVIFFVDHLEVGEVAIYQDRAVIVSRSGWVVGPNRPATLDLKEGVAITLPVRVTDQQAAINSLSGQDRKRLFAVDRSGNPRILSDALSRAIISSAKRMPLEQALARHGLAFTQAPPVASRG